MKMRYVVESRGCVCNSWNALKMRVKSGLTASERREFSFSFEIVVVVSYREKVYGYRV